jgi:sugar phosphate isomerase/epimerase
MACLAISELTTYRWSFEQDVEQFRAAGLSAIGVWRQKLADFGEERGAELLAQSGLAPSSLQWAGGFTGSDGRSHNDSLQDARQAIYAAELVRAPCLIIHSGARGIHTHKHARRLFRQALDKLLPVAEERGVALAVEPMSAHCSGEFTFLNCLDETLDLIATYDTAALRIALDTYHWGHYPAFMDRIPQLVPRLALVQLGDARQPPSGEENRCPLGEGIFPLAEIVKRLSAAGYDGFYEVELMGEEFEAADYCDVIARSVGTFERWMRASA